MDWLIWSKGVKLMAMCTHTGSFDAATASQMARKLAFECMRSPTVPNTTTELAPNLTISSSASMASRGSRMGSRPAHLSRFGACLHCPAI